MRSGDEISLVRGIENRSTEPKRAVPGHRGDGKPPSRPPPGNRRGWGGPTPALAATSRSPRLPARSHARSYIRRDVFTRVVLTIWRRPRQRRLHAESSRHPPADGPPPDLPGEHEEHPVDPASHQRESKGEHHLTLAGAHRLPWHGPRDSLVRSSECHRRSGGGGRRCTRFAPWTKPSCAATSAFAR